MRVASLGFYGAGEVSVGQIIVIEARRSVGLQLSVGESSRVGQIELD